MDAIVFYTCVCLYARVHIYACVHVCACACMHNACGGWRQRLNIRYVPLSFFIFFFLETRFLSEAGAHQLSSRAGHWAKVIPFFSLSHSFWQGCWIWARVLICYTAGATSLTLWSLLLSDSMSRLMPLDLKTSNPRLIYGKNKNLTMTYISGTDLIDVRIIWE